MATALSTSQIINVRSKFAAMFAALADSLAGAGARRTAAVHAPETQKVLAIRIVDAEDSGEHRATLHLAGELTNRSMQDLVAAVAALHAGGARRLVIDMAGVTRVSLAGVFALHNAARTLAGQARLNDEDGWSALRQMKADGILLDSAHLHLIHVPAGVRAYLQATGVTVPEEAVGGPARGED